MSPRSCGVRCSLAHLGAHLHHVLLHLHGDILVFDHVVHEVVFKLLVLDFSILVKLILHTCLLSHHPDHHFHGVATRIKALLALHLSHGFCCLALRLGQIIAHLILGERRFFDGLLLLELSLLRCHHVLCSLLIGCQALVSLLKLFLRDSDGGDYAFEELVNGHFLMVNHLANFVLIFLLGTIQEEFSAFTDHTVPCILLLFAHG